LGIFLIETLAAQNTNEEEEEEKVGWCWLNDIEIDVFVCVEGRGKAQRGTKPAALL
jgi:hypothetical protein